MGICDWCEKPSSILYMYNLFGVPEFVCYECVKIPIVDRKIILEDF